MAEGQKQRIIIPPPVPGTPEYYSYQRQNRELLPAEKRVGMVRDPYYKYTYKSDHKQSLILSLCIYLFGFLLIFLALICIKLPEPKKPIILELSFGVTESESTESTHIELSGTQNDKPTKPIGSDITENKLTNEPNEKKQIVQDTSQSFDDYLESISRKETDRTNTKTVSTNATEVVKNLSSSVAQAVSTNRASSAQYGSGDSMEFRLAQAGAQTGEIQISLFWNTCDDIDLHVYYTPGNGLSETINWKNRFGQLSRGILDVDMNAQGPQNFKCVENVFWPHRSSPRGMFVVKAQFFKSWSGLRSIPIIIRIKIGNNIETFNGNIWYGTSPVTITKFSY